MLSPIYHHLYSSPCMEPPMPAGTVKGKYLKSKEIITIWSLGKKAQRNISSNFCISVKAEANHTVWWKSRGFRIRFPLSKQPWDVGSGTFLGRSPRVRQSIAVFLCICRDFLGYLLLRCLLSLVWWSSLSPSWLAGLGRWDSQQLTLCCLLTLPILPSHFVFVPGRNREFDICPGHVPASLSCSLPHSEIRVSWLCVNQFCPQLVFFFSLRSGIKWQQAQPPSHTWVTSAVSVSKSLIILLSAQNSPLAFTNWLTPSHCPAPLGFSSSTTSPRKSPSFPPLPSSFNFKLGVGTSLCSPNAQSRDLWSQLTAQNSWLLPCSCVSVHLITSYATEHLIYLC